MTTEAPDIVYRQTWTPIGDDVVHAYMADPPGSHPWPPLAVLVPGLGLTRYLRPTADRLVASGFSCAVLDVLGSRSWSGLTRTPDVESAGRTVARWVAAQRPTGRCVLLGHSTGSQAALFAATELQDTIPELALVMAGPTFRPEHRRLARLALAALTAYRKDSPAELVVLTTVVRHASGVWSLLRSGMRDVPERRIRHLRVPLTLTAGEADALAPVAWLMHLAACAGTAETPTVRVLPGSHDNPFTHPDELAALVRELSSELR